MWAQKTESNDCEEFRSLMLTFDMELVSMGSLGYFSL
jgi:hypothetical protein